MVNTGGQKRPDLLSCVPIASKLIEDKMSHFFRLTRFSLLPLAIALSIAGCRKDPALVQADNSEGGTQDQSSDPSAANLPPAPDNSGAPASSYQQSPPPPDQGGAPY